jgi:hypothetical protein
MATLPKILINQADTRSAGRVALHVKTQGACRPRHLGGDGDFDGGIRPEMIAVMSMMLREPVANTTPNLGDKIDVALLSQVFEIANQI